LKDIKFQNNILLVNIKNLIFLLLIFSSLLNLKILSQQDTIFKNLPNDLNQKQWELVRDFYAIEAIKLLAKLDTLQTEIDSLKSILIYAEKFNCDEELYKLIEISNEEVIQFRIKFSEAESFITENKNTPNDNSINLFNSIKNSKIICLPEFNQRFLSLKNIIDNYTSSFTEKSYKNLHIVVEGETLQKISYKYYSTTKNWLLIWKFNKDIIENPNLIFPLQELKIPLIN
jgi:nucleoid-associated protein YgaU